MQTFLIYSQIIIAILLISSILLQHRGTGLGGAFASDASFYRSKRGIEKILYYFTIILAVLFVIIAVLNLIF